MASKEFAMDSYYINNWLPSTYQEVEYIQSSGTQYINTQFTPSNTTKVEWRMWWWWESWSHQMFGSRYAWNSSWRWFAIVSDAYQFNGNASVNHGMTNWADHIGEFSQSWLVVDWTTKVTPSTTTFTSPWPLYLFWLNNNWSFSEWATMKYYYFKIYDNWTLVRNFMPCYRKSDSVIWLYDLVNNQFYTNSWSWTFTKWADVSTNKAVYLWTNRIRPEEEPAPAEVTEEYTSVSVGSNISAQKDWYKIKQVTFEATWYYWSSAWKNWWMNLYNDVTTGTNLHVNIQLWWTWGYDYGTYWAYNWYWVERTDQTTQAIIKWNSSWWSRNNFYVKFVTTIDQTEYKFWTSSTSIWHQWTATHNSTAKQWITDLFNWTNLKISRNAWWNEDYFTSYKITIVYESI